MASNREKNYVSFRKLLLMVINKKQRPWPKIFIIQNDYPDNTFTRSLPFFLCKSFVRSIFLISFLIILYYLYIELFCF